MPGSGTVSIATSPLPRQVQARMSGLPARQDDVALVLVELVDAADAGLDLAGLEELAHADEIGGELVAGHRAHEALERRGQRAGRRSEAQRHRDQRAASTGRVLEIEGALVIDVA